jgi:hypothetical protein
MMRCLSKDLGANMHLPMPNGATPLCVAAQNGNLAMVSCLVKELDADVNEAKKDGATPVITAVDKGNLDMVHCLIKELGADANKAMDGRTTPLMTAALNGNIATRTSIIKSLVHPGALVRVVSTLGAAVTLLKKAGATAAEVAYLEVRECCANPGCENGGRKRCAVCKETRYCGMACRTVHWRTHRVDCQGPDVTSTSDKL